MTATHTRSYCNQALIDAGLPVERPNWVSMLSRTLEEAEKARREADQTMPNVTVDGGAVRQMRDDLGWSGRKLSEKAGVAVWTVYGIEGARFGATRYTTAKAIADALGVDLEDILDNVPLTDAA